MVPDPRLGFFFSSRRRHTRLVSDWISDVCSSDLISWGDGSSVTCSDSQGNTYSVATTQYDGVNNQSLAICYAANVKSGANTVTAAFSGSPLYRRLLIHEYRGIASTNPVNVVAKNIANGTTSANAITSTSAVTTASGG